MAQIAPIEAKTYSIGPFLNSHHLRIPELQRPYSWTKEQAVELFEDLTRVRADNSAIYIPQHFFGTIVLLNTASDRLHIIDGQQRLTTTSLVLGLIEQSILRVGARAEKSKGPASRGVAQQSVILAQEIHGCVWYSGPLDKNGNVQENLRILVSPEIQEQFTKLIGGEKPQFAGMAVSPARHLTEVAKFMLENYVEPPTFKGLEPVEQLRHLQECFETIRDHLLVVCLTTQSPDAGYDLFECLNARGLDLEALDLVKVWMLSQMAGPREANVASAMRDLSSGDRKRQGAFFVDYFKLRALKNPKNENAKTFAVDARRHIFLDDKLRQDEHVTPIQDRIEFELERMQRLSPIWNDLKDGKVPSVVTGQGQKRTWGAFRMELTSKDLGHQGANFPLLTVAAEFGGQQFDEYIQLIHAVERFFFRYKVICKGHVGELEGAYFDLIKRYQLKGCIDLDYSLHTLQDLLNLRASDNVFEVQLLDRLSYSNTAQKRIRYFLYTLDNYNYPNAPGTAVVDLAEFHLEHVAPQNPSGGRKLDLAVVNDIGNLTLLNPELNGGFGNKNFADKKAAAAAKKAQNLDISISDSRQIFYDSTSNSWEEKQIEQRRARLFDQAKKVFKLI